MADSIERTIYKLEIDDSAYVKGIESLSASTQKFSQLQQASNETLKANEAALKRISDSLAKAKQDLQNYTGTDENYRKQIEKTIGSLEKEHKTLSGVVDTNKKNYDSLTKSVNEFAAAQKKAAESPLPQVAPPPVSVAGGLRNQILGSIDLAGLSDLAEITQRTEQEFIELSEAIALADKALEGLAPDSEEFKQLAPIVEQGKIALKQFGEANKAAGEDTQSLRGQLRQAREELVKLEQAGKSGTKAYTDLELKTAKLTDAFNDQQQRIKILASDTKLLDFGKGAITAATAAFSAYTSVSVLAGGASEELQKKTLQLFAAMQLLNSIQEISNLTRREGTLATLASTGAQAAYTAVVGASTGALKVFRLALAATGIGAAVAVIGLLVAKYNELEEAQKEANKSQELLNDAIGSSEYSEAVKNVNELRINIGLAKDGFLSKEKVVKQYNETIGKTTGSVTSLTEAEKELEKNADAYIQFTLFKAAANLALDESAKKLLDSSKEQEGQARKLKEAVKGVQGAAGAFGLEASKEDIDEVAEATKDASDDRIKQGQEESKSALKIAEDFQKKAAEIAKQFKFNFFGGGGGKEAEDEFAKQKAALDKRLADLRRQEADGEIDIVKEFAAKRELEKREIDKNKNLTKPQKDILKAELDQINGVELQKALEVFRKKVTDARKKINDELIDLQQQNNTDTINLIRDEFDRRAALIDLNEKQQIENSKKATQERLDALEFDKLLLGEQVYQEAKAKIVSEGEIEVNNIIAGANADRQDLAADIFTKSLETLENVLSEQLLQLDETTAGKIQEQKNLLASGAINYEQFQKKLTKILADQKKERDKLRLAELNTELTNINKRLETVTDAEEKADLQKRQRSVRKEIADIQSEAPKDPNEKKVVDTVSDYANAIGGLTDSVIQFWQKANEAEAQALEKSISLQEKRVEAAQRIAERGNATYLKQEEDRLNELNVKRENAARRQLAIDAALQASQLLVAITGAISKIANPLTGVADVIGSIAVIVGSLAAGYGLVKSLQGNQPRLAKGDKYVKRNGHPSGVDTIPAWLNEGEAVIPTDKNKAYHETISAIFDGKIPAKDMNHFVKTYHKIKSVPQVDYGRIKQASELHISSDGRMAVAISEQNKLIQENNDLQRQTLRAMKNMSVSANIDRDGVAIMVNEYVQQMNIDKKI